MQILVRDITEHKRTEEALRISQARLQKVAANLPGVIYQFLLRPDGSQEMLYISSGCRELLELEPEAIQQDIDLLNSLIHPDDLQAFNDSGATSARTLQPWHYEGRIITPSGKLKWIQGISRPEKLAGGEILWDGLLLDITQRKQAEEQLRQYQEHLEELVAQRTASLQNANEQLSQEIAERQQVEAALRESEARFRAAAEGSLDAFFILQCLRDETGRIVDFTFADLNSNAEKMISMSKEEVIGKRLCELIPINRTAGFFEKYVWVVETQTVLEEEFPISTPEISATRLHHQVVPLPDGVAITSRDISGCKSAQEALRESEEKYRLLFSRELDAISFAGALRAIALFDVETGQFLDVNEAFVKLYGYTKEEALSLTPADVSAEPENTKTAIEKAPLTGGEHICLRWHKKKDGTVFPVELCAGTFVWKGRTVMCAVLRDITERQQAQEALFKQKQTLRAILDNAPIWIWMTDTLGRMLLVNKTFCENVGVCEAQFLAAAHYKEILPEEESRACMASEAAAWVQDTPYHAEEILRFADGQPHTLEVIKTQIKDSSGTAIGLIGLGVDVTEHKQAQRELQQSEARFRELAQREALLNRMVNQIRNSLDIDTIVETALHEVCNLLCTNYTGLMWWRADACGWEIVRVATADSAPSQLPWYTTENVGSSVESLRRGETLRIDEVDTLDDPILKQYMLEMGCTSQLW